MVLVVHYNLDSEKFISEGIIRYFMGTMDASCGSQSNENLCKIFSMQTREFRGLDVLLNQQTLPWQACQIWRSMNSRIFSISLGQCSHTKSSPRKTLKSDVNNRVFRSYQMTSIRRKSEVQTTDYRTCLQRIFCFASSSFQSSEKFPISDSDNDGLSRAVQHDVTSLWNFILSPLLGSETFPNANSSRGIEIARAPLDTHCFSKHVWSGLPSGSP